MSWLEAALDYGIKEADFWEMTIAELSRAVESKKRIQERELKEKATFDYILADLIGRSVSRLYSSSNKMPSIAETYPALFSAEEIEAKRQEQKQELSVLRLKQFTQSFNKRFEGV
jgi:hypothetical protein